MNIFYWYFSFDLNVLNIQDESAIEIWEMMLNLWGFSVTYKTNIRACQSLLSFIVWDQELSTAGKNSLKIYELSYF